MPENAYGIVSRARWIILGTRLRSFTRLKARERFRRLVPRIIHLALKTMPYAYNLGDCFNLASGKKSPDFENITYA